MFAFFSREGHCFRASLNAMYSPISAYLPCLIVLSNPAVSFILRMYVYSTKSSVRLVYYLVGFSYKPSIYSDVVFLRRYMTVYMHVDPSSQLLAVPRQNPQAGLPTHPPTAPLFETPAMEN